MSASLLIRQDSTLTVGPGVTLRLGPCREGRTGAGGCFRLDGNGELHILGTASIPVRLTPASAATVDASLGSAWYGVEAADATTVELRHIHATGSAQVLLAQNNAKITIDDLQPDEDAGGPLVSAYNSVSLSITNSPGVS
jgi:hypothetical protein